MKRFKRVLSLELSLMMLLSVGSVLTTAHAADTVTINVVGRYDQTGARSMLDMINRFRTGNDAWYWNEDNKTKQNLVGKLQPYTYDYDLERIAMQRAAEIAVECDADHHRPDGTECWTAYELITSVGENVAFTHETMQDAFEDWQEVNEPYEYQGHRRSMLSSNFTTVGIAHFVMNGIDYWVQEFRKGGVDPVYCAPNNSDAVVPVKVLKSQFTNLFLTSNAQTIETAVDETIALPTIKAGMNTKEHWPDTIYIDARVTPTWKIGDTKIATISGGKIKGLKEGTTTLTASYTLTDKLKASVTMTIAVAGCAHEFTEVILQEETCDEEGLLQKTCTKCGEVFTEAIPAAHHWVQERVDSTCREQGYVMYSCERCGTFTDPEYLPLSDHRYNEEITKEPSCIEEGTLVKTCSECGEEIIEPISMIDHNYQEVGRTPATCKERGSIQLECTMCHEPKTVEIPTIAHHFEEVSNTPATCTAPGLMVEACSECHLQKEHVLPMLEHDYREISRTAPSCTDKGIITYTCFGCGYSYTEEIAERGHNYQEVSRTDATYDKSGSIKYTCSNCGDSYTKTIAKKIRNGFFTIGGKKYYYKNDKKLTGWQQISKKWYYFDGSGVMLTGWQKVGGKWYYFNGSGVMLTGWQKVGGKWYYFNSSGAMLTGWQKISGKWYYFNSSGAMLTGWQKIGGTWYYFNSGGDMKTGWLKDSGSWYFFNTSGAMLTGSWKINGKTYYFNSGGVCTNP